MTMSKGDLSPAALTIRPSFTRPPGKCSSWLSEPSAIQTSPLAATPIPIRPVSLSLKGKSPSLPTGRPSRSMTRILPLKLLAQTLSRVTAVPQPTPSIPMPVKPVIGGGGGGPPGGEFTTPPPLLRGTPGGGPRLPFWPPPGVGAPAHTKPPAGGKPPPPRATRGGGG